MDMTIKGATSKKEWGRGLRTVSHYMETQGFVDVEPGRVTQKWEREQGWPDQLEVHVINDSEISEKLKDFLSGYWEKKKWTPGNRATRMAHPDFKSIAGLVFHDREDNVGSYALKILNGSKVQVANDVDATDPEPGSSGTGPAVGL